MWDRFAIFPEDDDLSPLKKAGAILWTAVIITALIVLW